MMVRQNKWRAARYGTHAQLVDSYTHQVLPVQQVVEELVERLRPTAAALECGAYLEGSLEMAARPSWADRQVRLLAETGDPREVVRQLTAASRVLPPVAAG